MNIKGAVEYLTASGVWNYDSKLIKNNCSKCYDRRYIHYNSTHDEYTPCKCVLSKVDIITKEEKKRTVMAIGSSSLEGIENIND